MLNEFIWLFIGALVGIVAILMGKLGHKKYPPDWVLHLHASKPYFYGKKIAIITIPIILVTIWIRAVFQVWTGNEVELVGFLIYISFFAYEMVTELAWSIIEPYRTYDELKILRRPPTLILQHSLTGETLVMGVCEEEREGVPPDPSMMKIPVPDKVIDVQFLICTENDEPFYIVFSKEAQMRCIYTTKEKSVYVVAPFIEWGVSDADSKRWRESIFDSKRYEIDDKIFDQSICAKFVFA